MSIEPPPSRSGPADLLGSSVPAAPVVVARGELDLATVGRFRGALTERLAQGCTHLVVDLTEVTFIDSSGLGALVNAHRSLQRRGGRLRLVCRRPRVLRVLSLTGLDTLLAVHGELADAVATVAAETGQCLAGASASSEALSAAPMSTAIESR